MSQEIPRGRLEALSSTILPPADTLPEPVIVDVMFLYTSQALIGAGTREKIRRALMESIDNVNYCLTNSRVNVQIHPVYIDEIAYAESGDIDTDLSRLTNYQGILSRVSSLRADYKADIVCLLTETDSQGRGGTGAGVAPTGGNPAAAFAVVLRSQLGKYNTTLAHELGHLMGCAHDREHAGDLSFYKNFRPYIFGYRFVVEGVTYIDAMAYEPGISLPLFSNPRIDMDGVSLGVAEGMGASDTSRTVNETAPYVAAYRTALSRVEFNSAKYRTDKRSPTAQMHLIRIGDLNTSVRVTVSISEQSTAKVGLDYIRPTTMNVEFSTNQAEATFEIPLLKDDRSEPTKTILLSLTSPSPNTHGIGWQGTTTIHIDDAPPVVRFSGDPIVVQEKNGFVEIQPDSVDQVGASAFDPLLSPTWRLEAGSAVAGKDFVPASGKLTYTAQAIPGGQRYVPDPIRIELLDDFEPEADKTLRIIFESMTNRFGDPSVTYSAVTNELRISDNDRLGSLLRVPGIGLNQDGDMGIAIRHDGKMMVWGWFDKLRGIARTAIGLLNADGSVDESFEPPTFLAGHRPISHLSPAGIWMLRFQPDGKLLVAGSFSRVNGQVRGSLVRLKSDGSLDDTFSGDLNFDGLVSTAAILPDGKILVGGRFEKINGEKQPYLARLHPNGTVDDSFRPNGGPASTWFVDILAITLQRDGKILIGGYFEKYNDILALNVARLNSDGTLDSSFNLKGAGGAVSCIRVQADGKIIVAGSFNTLGDRSSPGLGRLLPNGSSDLSFISPRPNGQIYEVIPLPDGSFFTIGAFTQIANTKRRFVALLNSDASINREFDPGAGPDEIPGGGAVHADGTLYLSGRFEKISDVEAPSIAALKIGLPGSVVAETKFDDHGSLLSRVDLFPGSYDVETSTDFHQWSKTATFSSEGFGRISEIRLPATKSREFLRLKNATP